MLKPFFFLVTLQLNGAIWNVHLNVCQSSTENKLCRKLDPIDSKGESLSGVISSKNNVFRIKQDINY